MYLIIHSKDGAMVDSDKVQDYDGMREILDMATHVENDPDDFPDHILVFCTTDKKVDYATEWMLVGTEWVQVVHVPNSQTMIGGNNV